MKGRLKMAFRYNHLIEPDYSMGQRDKTREKIDPIVLPRHFSSEQIVRINRLLRTMNREEVVSIIKSLYPSQGHISTGSKNYCMERTGKKGKWKIENPDIMAREDYLKLFTEHEKSADLPPVPGLFSICMGYDIQGPYADQAAIKRRLFDPSKIKDWKVLKLSNGKKYSYYPFITVNTANSSDYYAFAERTAKHLSKKLVHNVGIDGDYCGFHGEFDLSYNGHKTVDVYHQFAMVNSAIAKYYIHFNETDDYSKYLHDDVLEAFEKMAPEDFYDDYGVFFTTGIMVGGRLRQTSVTDVFRMCSETELKMLLKASFLSIVESELSNTYREYNEEFRSNSSVLVTTKGGRVGLIDESNITPEQYLAWKSSVEDNPVFCDFTNPTTQKALTPIWKIVPDKKKKAWKQTAGEHMQRLSGDFPYTTDWMARRAVKYSITTITSNKRPCTGTDSKITMRLTGKDPFGRVINSPWLQHDDGRNNHESGTTDEIEMPIIQDIGFPFKIAIHHDGSKDAPWWELKDLKVIGNNNFQELVAECNNAGFNNETKEFRLIPK